MDRDLAAPVKSHAGYSACDHPDEIEWKGSALRITKIIKQWREPGSKHYLVETNNGLHFKLAFSETSAQWLVSEVIISRKK